MSDEIKEPTIEDRIIALETMVQQQYRVLSVFKDGIDSAHEAIQQCQQLIGKLAQAGEDVSKDVINIAEMLKIHEKRLNNIRDWMGN